MNESASPHVGRLVFVKEAAAESGRGAAPIGGRVSRGIAVVRAPLGIEGPPLRYEAVLDLHQGENRARPAA